MDKNKAKNISFDKKKDLTKDNLTIKSKKMQKKPIEKNNNSLIFPTFDLKHNIPNVNFLYEFYPNFVEKFNEEIFSSSDKKYLGDIFFFLYIHKPARVSKKLSKFFNSIFVSYHVIKENNNLIEKKDPINKSKGRVTNDKDFLTNIEDSETIRKEKDLEKNPTQAHLQDSLNSDTPTLNKNNNIGQQDSLYSEYSNSNKLETDNHVNQSEAQNSEYIVQDQIQFTETPELLKDKEPVAVSNNKSKKFRIFYKIFGIILLLVGSFLLTLPIWLDGFLTIRNQIDSSKGLKYKSSTTDKIAQEQGYDLDENSLKPVPVDQNILVIPKIQVDAPINEGESEALLNYGVWRRPNGSDPTKGSNTILTSHRMDNLAGAAGPSTFYHLDKLEQGDDIIVYWEEDEFRYEVKEKKIVKDTDIYIEDPSDEDKLTLYTCHPIWSSEERLVIIAEPVK